MTTALRKHLRSALAATLTALLTAVPLWAQALDYHVTIDTTPLAGTSGYLALDLLGGTPGTTNTVVVSAFSGPLTLGAVTLTGGATGALPGPVTLTSGSFFNEYLQAVGFAAGVIQFDLSITNHYAPGDTPDQFALFLLDATLQPLGSSDPSGAGALLVVDLVSAPSIQVYSSPSATATVSAVPEPANAGLMLMGGLGLWAWRRVRRS